MLLYRILIHVYIRLCCNYKLVIVSILARYTLIALQCIQIQTERKDNHAISSTKFTFLISSLHRWCGLERGEVFPSVIAVADPHQAHSLATHEPRGIALIAASYVKEDPGVQEQLPNGCPCGVQGAGRRRHCSTRRPSRNRR